ncbi:MAG: acetyl-CoA carboxylase biotin carboxylase subunit, partial [Calditrichae bacterium]|nr:acetyl-CoA carboxylase biotin carboxylase subunit [Calditrichia bacterium]
PENNFYPSYGKLLLVKEPQGPGIRCDSGIYTGLEVPYYYDPILSKLIVWDENRERTIQKMKVALSDYIIMGVKTQILFMSDILDHPQFIKGQLHTHFIAEHFAKWKPGKQKEYRNIALLAAAILKLQKTTQPEKRESRTALSPWQLMGRWEIFSK